MSRDRTLTLSNFFSYLRFIIFYTRCIFVTHDSLDLAYIAGLFSLPSYYIQVKGGIADKTYFLNEKHKILNSLSALMIYLYNCFRMDTRLHGNI